MKRSILISLVLLAFSFTQFKATHAAVEWSGIVDPADPTTWTTATNASVAKSGTGTLTITGGGTVSARNMAVAQYIGSSGRVTVDGAGSKWTNEGVWIAESGEGVVNITGGGEFNCTQAKIGTFPTAAGEVTVNGNGSCWNNSGYLTLGSQGSGVLHIADGGEVSVGANLLTATMPGSSATIHLDHGTLTTGGFGCASKDLTGVGTINTHGLVTDVELVFDATHGSEQTLTLDGEPGQDVTVNLVVDGGGCMGAGYGAVGTMHISDGVVVESSGGYIGYRVGSQGSVTVDGPGSGWLSNHAVDVGNRGSGELLITGGSEVTWYLGRIGYHDTSTGHVTVDGATWTTTRGLDVSCGGYGRLDIVSGGTVVSGRSFVGQAVGPHSGTVVVEGDGSSWVTESELVIGRGGSGILQIAGGGHVSSVDGFIGYFSGSTGDATVDGSGSTWINSGDFALGRYSGGGTLHITGGGLVRIGGTLAIDPNTNGNCEIRMAGGGMLALNGNAGNSLTDFLDLIDGTDIIRYWDYASADWADIADARRGEDFTLHYYTQGDLAGYTVLTVCVPEPLSHAGLLGLCLAGLLTRKRRARCHRHPGAG